MTGPRDLCTPSMQSVSSAGRSRCCSLYESSSVSFLLHGHRFLAANPLSLLKSFFPRISATAFFFAVKKALQGASGGLTNQTQVAQHS